MPYSNTASRSQPLATKWEFFSTANCGEHVIVTTQIRQGQSHVSCMRHTSGHSEMLIFERQIFLKRQMHKCLANKTSVDGQ